MSVKSQARRLLLGTLTIVSLAGCGLFVSSSPSAVAQGNYYASGNAEFDAFFIALYRLQVELAKAPERPSNARTALATRLGLNRAAPTEQILARAKEEATRLRNANVFMKLELPPASSAEPGTEVATLRTSESPASEADKALLRELESSTTELLRVQSVMAAKKRALDQLRSQAVTIETQVDTAFRLEGPWKRSEVRENLSDAQKLITLMNSRTDEVAKEASKLLDPLREVLDTDDGRLSRRAEPVASEPVPDAKPAPKKSKPATKTAPRSAPAATKPAAPKPAPAAPASDSDEVPSAPKAPPPPAAPARDFEP
jgi:hypothetical protein